MIPVLLVMALAGYSFTISQRMHLIGRLPLAHQHDPQMGTGPFAGMGRGRGASGFPGRVAIAAPGGRLGIVRSPAAFIVATAA